MYVLVRTPIVKGLSSSYEGLNPSQSAQDHIRRESPVFQIRVELALQGISDLKSEFPFSYISKEEDISGFILSTVQKLHSKPSTIWPGLSFLMFLYSPEYSPHLLPSKVLLSCKASLAAIFFDCYYLPSPNALFLSQLERTSASLNSLVSFCLFHSCGGDHVCLCFKVFVPYLISQPDHPFCVSLDCSFK